MSKKKLDTTNLLNELKNGSVFFQHETERTDNRSEKRTEFRTENRTVQYPIKRLTKLYSFEFFEDQITFIKRIKIETELSGNRISLSEVVRNALDHYFDSVRKSERSEERTVIRTEKDPLDNPF
jgi:hypothetical protein